jgi:hypothetical protein
MIYHIHPTKYSMNTPGLSVAKQIRSCARVWLSFSFGRCSLRSMIRNGCAAHVRERKEQLRGVVVGVAFALARSWNGAVTSRLTGKSKKAEAPGSAWWMGGLVGSNKHAARMSLFGPHRTNNKTNTKEGIEDNGCGCGRR